MNPAAGVPSAAQRLTGLTLDGWKVLRLMEPSPVATGGCFSSGYEVESASGRKAYLKALDYSRALQSPDPAQALNAMTAAFIFERELLDRCSERRLSRIVTAITSGKIILDNDPFGGLVEYLIFERADGDIRQQMSDIATFDLRWRLLCLRHIATALRQLHGELIAHQDVKPSNVLLFDRDSKLADLGRAACRGLTPPHEAFDVAGDPSYAPPELLYGFLSPEWALRRLGCDVYLFGSMLVWFFTGLGTTALAVAALHESHRPTVWRGTYTDVLPYVREAFGQVLLHFRSEVPPSLADRLTRILEELCDPDPTLRGHPKDRTRSGNQFSLERYITEFDLLAARVQYGASRN
jgi:eukaryotic-like serine/threonine-protein kinase